MTFATKTLAALLAMLPLAAQAAPVPVQPGAATITLGALRVTALRDLSNVMPNDGKVFGKDVGPAAVAETLKAAGAPADPITLSVGALLVRGGGKVVLIDSGFGPRPGGVLPRSLALAGVRPEQVTDVLITHAHPDHIGGLLDADGKPAFPNATIRLSAPEWAALSARPEAAALVAAIGAKVQTFQPTALVLPMIRSMNLAGHTPGHAGYQVISGNHSLIDLGDTAHSSIISLAHPEWAIGYDGDAEAGKARRMSLLSDLAATGDIVFAPHFPFPGFGRIQKSGEGYEWVPLAGVK